MKNEQMESGVELFHSFEQDVKKMYKDPAEVERVLGLVAQAEQQSEVKKIAPPRDNNNFKRAIIKWKLRFQYGIHWRKPFYPLRLLRNYALQYWYNLKGKDKFVFRGIEFALTFKCNFRCNHCLCSRIDESDAKKEMEPHEYKRVVKEAMAMGATTFGMEGGEPFVHKKWEEIVRTWKPKYNHIIVSSNGYLLDEKLVKKLADIGISTVNLSLDSGIRELHDLFRRKKGSFDRVMAAIQHCKKNRINVVLNTVVHTGNLYTEGFIKVLEIGEKEKVMVNCLFAKGVGSFKDNNAMLGREDFKNFKKIVAPFNYWSVHHWSGLKSNHGGVGCPGVKEMVNMTPYGDVMNCANNHIYFGNIREEPLKEIRDRALKKTPFGKYRPCFLTQDKEFMNVYYPLLEEKGHITISEYNEARERYRKEQNL